MLEDQSTELDNLKTQIGNATSAVIPYNGELSKGIEALQAQSENNNKLQKQYDRLASTAKRAKLDAQSAQQSAHNTRSEMSQKGGHQEAQQLEELLTPSTSSEKKRSFRPVGD